MRLSIRGRLTLWYTVLLAGTVLALGGHLVLQLHGDLLQGVDDEARTTSAGIAHDLVQGVPAASAAGDPSAGVPGEVFRDAARAVLPPARSGAQLLDDHGRVLLSYGLATRGALLDDAPSSGQVPAPFTTELPGAPDDGQRVVTTALTLPDGHPALLVVAVDLRRVDEAVARVVGLLLLAGPVVLAISALGAYALARRGLLPVHRMTEDASRIGTARLHERVAVPRTRDEVARLAFTLNEMLSRIERGVLDRRALVADASHELRTPLAVMRAEIDVSLKADDLPEAARGVLRSARDEVDRMGRTVENLLTLGEVEEERLALLAVHTELGALARDAAGAFATLAELKGVRLVVEGSPGTVVGDPRRLRLALTNLVDNAVKYTPAAGTVRVRSWQHGAEVGVTVSDDGPGLAPDQAAHVFDRFYRAAGVGVDGSGLGLAICREVVLAHGGRVWVESSPGAGSAFSLALRVRTDDEAPSLGGTGPRRAAGRR